MVERIRRTRPGGSGLVRAMQRRDGKADSATVSEHRVVPLGGDWDSETQFAIDLLKAGGMPTRAARDTDHVHVSDAIGKCLRKIALIRRLNSRTPAEKISDGQGVTFAIGDALHDFVKGRFIAAHPDKVWARWTCVCKHTSIGPCTFSRRGRHTTCPQCGSEVNQHNEVPMFDPELDLVGNPDLVLWLDNLQAFYPVEIKSMAANQFKELVRVVPDHMIQLSFYWHLFKVNNHPLVDTSSVLYVNKEWSFKLPYKEMPIAQPASQERLIPYFADLKALKLAKEGGPLPARTMCSTLDASEAKKCHVCVACFQS